MSVEKNPRPRRISENVIRKVLKGVHDEATERADGKEDRLTKAIHLFGTDGIVVDVIDRTNDEEAHDDRVRAETANEIARRLDISLEESSG